MNPYESARIVGAAESDIGNVSHLTPAGMMAIAARRAIDDAALSLGEVDAVFAVTPYHSMAAVTLSEYLGIHPKYFGGTDIGGASFLAHVRHAVAAIAAGMCEVALIAYGSSQRSDRGRLVSRSEVLAYEEPYRPRYPVTQNALIAQRYMYEFGLTAAQMASVAVAARRWSRLNPRAFEREPITVDDVLASPLISSPIHRLDCCLVTDGGAALVVAKRERVVDAKRAVKVLAGAEASTHRNISAMADLTISAGAQSGPTALADAGVATTDVDFVELYDAFTIGPILELEDLGFVAKGEAGGFFAGGHSGPGGLLPVNTNGGGLAYTHPGMLGLFLIIEAVRQLRGEAGRAQVADAEIGVVHGIGGALATASTLVLAKPC